jgi:hypothetical protein
MKKTSIFVVLAGLVLALALLPATNAGASKALAEKEDLVCTSCHDKPGSKLLTDRGKYYELTQSLEGYGKIESAFGRCTHCHSRKPGSQKLTKAGKAFNEGVGGMDELRKWVRESHPAKLPPGAAPPSAPQR